MSSADNQSYTNIMKIIQLYVPCNWEDGMTEFMNVSKIQLV